MQSNNLLIIRLICKIILFYYNILKRVFKRKKFFKINFFQYDCLILFFFYFGWICQWICRVNLNILLKLTPFLQCWTTWFWTNFSHPNSTPTYPNTPIVCLLSHFFFFLIPFHVLCSCTLVCVHMHSIVLEKKKYAPHTRVATLVNNSRTCRSTIVHVMVSTFCF